MEAKVQLVKCNMLHIKVLTKVMKYGTVTTCYDADKRTHRDRQTDRQTNGNCPSHSVTSCSMGNNVITML